MGWQGRNNSEYLKTLMPRDDSPIVPDPWRLLLRETGLFEYLCEHGLGHPSPLSVQYMNLHGPPGSAGSWGVHGCDLCCSASHFPGKFEEDITIPSDLVSLRAACEQAIARSADPESAATGLGPDAAPLPSKRPQPHP